VNAHVRGILPWIWAVSTSLNTLVGTEMNELNFKSTKKSEEIIVMIIVNKLINNKENK
jgi:hypothetical protein